MKTPSDFRKDILQILSRGNLVHEAEMNILLASRNINDDRNIQKELDTMVAEEKAFKYRIHGKWFYSLNTTIPRNPSV